MKSAERERARELRRERGWSLRQLSAELGISKGTASRWVADIELTLAQSEALRHRGGSPAGRAQGNLTRRRRAEEQRHHAQAVGRLEARGADPLHRGGCMLYWAEGAKSRNTVGLANSDPDLIRVFIAFLEDFYNVARERFTLRCNCFLRSHP